ncbi:MAG: hypothetical protein ACI4TA_01555, partial [Acetatifactor sp.]
NGTDPYCKERQKEPESIRKIAAALATLLMTLMRTWKDKSMWWESNSFMKLLPHLFLFFE